MKKAMPERDLRAQLAALLAWEDAHVGFDRAVAGVPGALRGRVPPGAQHSLWQLVEHLRLAQRDILEFCTDAHYKERHWPDDYWPVDPEPPSARAWSSAIKGYDQDRTALQALAADRRIDLFARIPHGSGQTYLRELLLVADHAAYHVGQIIVVRRLLGIWRG